MFSDDYETILQAVMLGAGLGPSARFDQPLPTQAAIGLVPKAPGFQNAQDPRMAHTSHSYSWSSGAQETPLLDDATRGVHAQPGPVPGSDHDLVLKLGLDRVGLYRAQAGARDLRGEGYQSFVPHMVHPGEDLYSFYQRVAAPEGVSWLAFLEANRLTKGQNFPRQLFDGGVSFTKPEAGFENRFAVPAWLNVSRHQDGVLVGPKVGEGYVPYDDAQDFWVVPQTTPAQSGSWSQYKTAIEDADRLYAERYGASGTIGLPDAQVDGMRQQALARRYNAQVDENFGLLSGVVRFFEPAELNHAIGEAASPGTILSMMGVGRLVPGGRSAGHVMVRELTVSQQITLPNGRETTLPAGTQLRATDAGRHTALDGRPVYAVDFEIVVPGAQPGNPRNPSLRAYEAVGNSPQGPVATAAQQPGQANTQANTPGLAGRQQPSTPGGALDQAPVRQMPPNPPTPQTPGPHNAQAHTARAMQTMQSLIDGYRQDAQIARTNGNLTEANRLETLANQLQTQLNQGDLSAVLNANIQNMAENEPRVSLQLARAYMEATNSLDTPVRSSRRSSEVFDRLAQLEAVTGTGSYRMIWSQGEVDRHGVPRVPNAETAPSFTEQPQRYTDTELRAVVDYFYAQYQALIELERSIAHMSTELNSMTSEFETIFVSARTIALLEAYLPPSLLAYINLSAVMTPSDARVIVDYAYRTYRGGIDRISSDIGRAEETYGRVHELFLQRSPEAIALPDSYLGALLQQNAGVETAFYIRNFGQHLAGDLGDGFRDARAARDRNPQNFFRYTGIPDELRMIFENMRLEMPLEKILELHERTLFHESPSSMWEDVFGTELIDPDLIQGILTSNLWAHMNGACTYVGESQKELIMEFNGPPAAGAYEGLRMELRLYWDFDGDQNVVGRFHSLRLIDL